MSTPPVMEPQACGHCGIAERGHGRQFADVVGWHAWSAPSQEQVLARMKARHLAQEVARHGAFPVPVGSPSDHSLAAFRTVVAASDANTAVMATVADASGLVAGLRADNERLTARVAELEAERSKYVGKEPTIAEEMAYLSRCLDSVLSLCDEQDKAARLFELPQPEWIARVREAADGLVERTSYPPALPWAHLMGGEGLSGFIDELADAATRNATGVERLAAVEKVCGTWRLIAEAQDGHNTAPGPDAVTQVFVPVASYRALDGLRERLPLDDPDRHALDFDADARFARMACEHPDECACASDSEDRLLDGDELKRAVRGHLFGGGAL